ncbi:MAG: Asp-tRNA(Asn)/Glu-tRNA(Gln) amidotransferase subunit GatA [Cytophagales bacterium]|nr:Asp-tRNA(Asn)/Glu-tRNA(Gln) amidotransferase subunit GatA [Cytophagales bacterium]
MQSHLKTGTFSCVDRVRFHLKAIERNTPLNAFLNVYADEALAHAEETDRKIAAGTAGKLAGLIVGIKAVFAYQGHPLSAASKILDGFESQFSATAVERLLAEDAIIIGHQNCDEFGMGSSTENSAYGPTLNPHDTTRVPGGSSGGSAAAVAAGMCQVALGSDTGGSVRQPASFCGLIGLKPTYSRVSRYGLVSYASSFDTVGLLAKEVEDVARVLTVIAGADAYDSTVSREPVPDYEHLVSGSPLRVGYIRQTMDIPVLQEDVRQAFKGALDQLQSLGHPVTAIDFPLLDSILPTYYILATAEASSNLSRYDGVRYGYRSPNTNDLESLYKKTRSEGFGKEVQRRILLGTFVLSSDYHDAYHAKAQKVRRLIREETKRLLLQYDVILLPTAPTTAFKVGDHAANPMAMYFADVFSVQANVAGVPAISFPYGKDRQGLPIGLQAMADDFQEGKLLQLAKLLSVDQ